MSALSSNKGAPGEKIRVLFLIRQLGIGGAERQLLNLVAGMDQARFEVHVATMYGGGGLLPLFAAQAHVRVHSLEKAGRWDLRAFLSRLVRLARGIRPHIVHGYMGGANELAWLAARSAGAKCIWGIRVSDLLDGEQNWSVSALFRIGAWLSRSIDLVIANSERGRTYHVAAGYSAKRFIVIPNGIDIERFTPRTTNRLEWRTRHALPLDRPLLLMPARMDPMKDHPTLLRALAALDGERDFLAVCLGSGPEALRAEYQQLASTLGIADRVRFIDANTDVADAYAAADIVVLSSAYGEGFPNVLGEAMACGRVCVATDVGDAAIVMNAADRTVRPRDVAGLADALRRVLRLPAEEMAALERAARMRIETEFSIPQLVARTSDVLSRVARGERVG